MHVILKDGVYEMKESELFLPIKKLLMEQYECSEVYGEVLDIDVLAIRGDYDVGVELKTSLNWKVIEQALKRTHICDYVFVGVPESNTINYIALDTLKRYGLGLMTVNKSGGAKLVLQPSKHQVTRRKKARSYVQEHHSKTIGGVKTGEGPTAYSETMVKIKAYMNGKGWVTAQDISKAVKTHYTSDATSQIRDTLRAHWNKDWCEVEKRGSRIYFRYKNSPNK